ncbi:hypothetical protein [Microbacterium capsulatum]|uniref:Uncharacterized protein n=1 Tax=Microbacterium capsulatum TaxID=3041921 RepID=A0ABU0XJB8_9MICO|nr:hypothetical protein [Microbacterium sp. ASV81]MDQ4214759.1 hypothetical protein [Microbacterium sp. ASV81]
MNNGGELFVLGLLSAALLVTIAYLAWVLVGDWLLRRRAAPQRAELDGALADLASAEAEARTALRLGSLRARRLLIEASYEYGSHVADADDTAESL